MRYLDNSLDSTQRSLNRCQNTKFSHTPCQLCVNQFFKLNQNFNNADIILSFTLKNTISMYKNTI
jgi:hypothetical protein